MMLTDNAFALLGAMPRDDRRALNEKADEAALLGGDDVESALNQLMQMNRRIASELAWLPGSTAEAAEGFLDYARAVSEGQHAALPPMTGLGTPLAQANALAALFEIWPTDLPELFVGLCRAMDALINRITVKDAFRALNADRAAGHWEAIPDPSALTEPLNAHLRQLCAPVGKAVGSMAMDTAARLLTGLLRPDDGRGGIDPDGAVAQAAGDAYSMQAHEKLDDLRREILADAQRMNDTHRVGELQLNDLQRRVNIWCELSAPLRLLPGPARGEAKSIASAVRNVLVSYVNTTPPVEKKKTVLIGVSSQGTRSATITYKSHSDCVNKAIGMNTWLRSTFPEQIDLLSQLNEDDRQLKQALANEAQMLERAEREARGR